MSESMTVVVHSNVGAITHTKVTEVTTTNDESAELWVLGEDKAFTAVYAPGAWFAAVRVQGDEPV